MDPCKKNELGVSDVDAAREVLDLTVALRDAIVAAGGSAETVSDILDEHAKGALRRLAKNGVHLRVCATRAVPAPELGVLSGLIDYSALERGVIDTYKAIYGSNQSSKKARLDSLRRAARHRSSARQHHEYGRRLTALAESIEKGAAR